MCGLNFRPALGMQLKVRLVRKHPSRLGVQLKDPVHKRCVHINKFDFLPTTEGDCSQISPGMHANNGPSVSKGKSDKV